MKIGISNFARERHTPESGRSYFKGEEAGLIQLVLDNWDKRKPGIGRSDLEKVVVVPVTPIQFMSTTATLTDGMELLASVERRQPKEDPYVRVRAVADPDPCNFVDVVLYSAAALLENDGERSGEYDWEIVAINASASNNEPIHPLTMARNFLVKPGGTKCVYTAEQFAESIYYWASRVTVRSL